VLADADANSFLSLTEYQEMIRLRSDGCNENIMELKEQSRNVKVFVDWPVRLA
jgi:hypothetical protein